MAVHNKKIGEKMIYGIDFKSHVNKLVNQVKEKMKLGVPLNRAIVSVVSKSKYASYRDVSKHFSKTV